MKQSPYQKKLDVLLDALANRGQTSDNANSDLCNSKKPTLLLHACCGPCSSYVLEYLADFFDITVFYYNPNIYPQEEYERRLNELKTLYTKFPPAIENKISVIEENYNTEEFYNAVGTKSEHELAVEPEKGERCRRCYEFRLKKSFEFACKNHFDYFCTTLSISPFKDAEKINVIGEALVEEAEKLQKNSPKWLPSDFKKKNGFKRSLELSTEYNLYRQDYCGCVYSKQNTGR